MASTYYILKAGIAPPDLRNYPEQVRLMFWGWVVEEGLKVKDGELARGLNAKGQALPPVSARTRRRRRSAMTSSGKGDPSAPYLMPGRGLSRTRSLLAGKPHADYAEFWWRYDAYTGDSWGKILSYHARRGEAYNVIGLSPRGVSAVAYRAKQKWERWKAGSLPAAQPRPIEAPQVTTKVVGETDLRYTTFGIGAKQSEVEEAIADGRFSGFRTADEWRRYWRGRAAVPRLAEPSVTSYSVRKGSSNVLLQHAWGDFQPRPGVLPMASTKVDRAVNTLIDALLQMPELSIEQLEAVIGDADMFDQAIVKAVRGKRLAFAKEGDRIVLKVVG